MYGAPGPGYQGRNEAENVGVENEQMEKEDTFLITNQPRPANTARLIYPEYMCFFPTIFLRGAAACEQDCPEDVRENAKCQRNGWDWAARAAELRTEELKVKRKTMADRDREKGEKERETEGSENDNPENYNPENDNP